MHFENTVVLKKFQLVLFGRIQSYYGNYGFIRDCKLILLSYKKKKKHFKKFDCTLPRYSDAFEHILNAHSDSKQYWRCVYS